MFSNCIYFRLTTKCLKRLFGPSEVVPWSNDFHETCYQHIVPILAIFGRFTLDFRESKCFLREPETLVEMKESKTVPLQSWTGLEGSRNLRVPEIWGFQKFEGSRNMRVPEIWGFQKLEGSRNMRVPEIWGFQKYEGSRNLRVPEIWGFQKFEGSRNLRVPEVWGSQISRQLAHEGGKVVSFTHRPPLPPGNIPGTHFC